MSKLVGAMESHAYMDRGGLVEIDLHEGLETTITVLGHKLKHAAIEVVREYDRSLPELERPRLAAAIRFLTDQGSAVAECHASGQRR